MPLIEEVPSKEYVKLLLPGVKRILKWEAVNCESFMQVAKLEDAMNFSAKADCIPNVIKASTAYINRMADGSPDGDRDVDVIAIKSKRRFLLPISLS